MKILSLALLLLIFLSPFISCSKKAEVASDGPPEVVEKPNPRKTDAWMAQQLKVEAINTQVRKEKLVEFEQIREKIAQAHARMPELRNQIFAARRTEWAAILENFDAEYQELRRQAKLTKHQMVDCTICGGDTYLDYCLFCHGDSDGVCSECEGTGEYFIDDLCPACLGTGKCYMCSGTKIMMCLFCDDGSIDLALPPHYQTIDLY